MGEERSHIKLSVEYGANLPGHMGVLTEITGNARNRAFRYGPYVDLF